MHVCIPYTVKVPVQWEQVCQQEVFVDKNVEVKKMVALSLRLGFSL